MSVEQCSLSMCEFLDQYPRPQNEKKTWKDSIDKFQLRKKTVLES